MLSYQEIQNIGREACINAIGREFYEQYKQWSTAGGGNPRGEYICYVAVSNKPLPQDGSERKWTRLARCKVNAQTGEVYGLELETNDADN